MSVISLSGMKALWKGLIIEFNRGLILLVIVFVAFKSKIAKRYREKIRVFSRVFKVREATIIIENIESHISDFITYCFPTMPVDMIREPIRAE